MSMSNADCVIALSFGVCTSKSHINPNEEIAHIALAFGLPIITQEEVAAHCKSPLVVTKRQGYLDTWEVLTGAKLIMEKNGYRKAMLIAHKAHIKRAKKQASKLGITYVISERLPGRWDKHSQQWWTRAAWFWWFHEVIFTPRLKIMKQL